MTHTKRVLQLAMGQPMSSNASKPAPGQMASKFIIAATKAEPSNCHELLRSKAAVVNVMVGRRDVVRVRHG